MMGMGRGADPAGPAEDRAAVVQPLCVHSVARPVKVATRDAFVRLHEIEPPAGDFAAYRPREAPVAAEAPDLKRVAANHPPGVPGPFPRPHPPRPALLTERCATPFDERRGPPLSAITQPHPIDAPSP